MKPIDYSILSPGIRELVRELREVHGLETVDSGDGSNHAAGMQGARPYRHVAGIVPGHFRGGLIGFADYFQTVYPDARIEVSYSPGEYALFDLLPDGYPDEVLAEVGVSRVNPRELYYMEDSRSVVGNCLLWWAKDHKGYTCHLERAHVFTKDEACRISKKRPTDVPWPKMVIDSIAGSMVDHQRLPDRAQLLFKYPELSEW